MSSACARVLDNSVVRRLSVANFVEAAVIIDGPLVLEAHIVLEPATEAQAHSARSLSRFWQGQRPSRHRSAATSPAIPAALPATTVSNREPRRSKVRGAAEWPKPSSAPSRATTCASVHVPTERPSCESASWITRYNEVHLRVSENPGQDFGKSRTRISVSPGERFR